MRVCIRTIHPIGIHRAQVLNLQLNKTARQLATVPQPRPKRIRLVLELPAQDIHKKPDDGVDGREDLIEQHEPDDDGLVFFVEEAETLE